MGSLTGSATLIARLYGKPLKGNLQGIRDPLRVSLRDPLRAPLKSCPRGLELVGSKPSFDGVREDCCEPFLGGTVRVI